MARRKLTKPEVAVVAETAGRQKHTQALAHLPNINPMPVLKCDAEGRVLFLNSAAESFLLSLGLSQEDVSRGSWKKNGALHSVIKASYQAATSACSRTSLRRW